MKNLISVFLIISFVGCNAKYQNFSQTKSERYNPSLIEQGSLFISDTNYIYLEDTSYYIKKDISQLFEEFDNKQSYFNYFTSTSALEFQFKDSLSDGFYILVSLDSNQFRKCINRNDHIVATGEFNNRMKQGKFTFYQHPLDHRMGSSYKEMFFINDTANGLLREFFRDNLSYAAEYNMGIKDGFCIYWNNGYPKVQLYKNGERIKQTQF